MTFTKKNTPGERLMLVGFGMTLTVLLLVSGIALNTAAQSTTFVKIIESGVVLLLTALAFIYVRILRVMAARLRIERALQEAQAPLLIEGALQHAIFNSANFSCIATDPQGVIQIFNVGAERMLGYAAIDAVNKMTPAGLICALLCLLGATAGRLEPWISRPAM